MSAESRLPVRPRVFRRYLSRSKTGLSKKQWAEPPGKGNRWRWARAVVAGVWRAEVRIRRAEAREQRTEAEDRIQRTEVGVQRAEVRGQKSECGLRPIGAGAYAPEGSRKTKQLIAAAGLKSGQFDREGIQNIDS